MKFKLQIMINKGPGSGKTRNQGYVVYENKILINLRKHLVVYENLDPRGLYCGALSGEPSLGPWGLVLVS